jgi:Terminase large subunit, T4likevirus-type, N-terminal
MLDEIEVQKLAPWQAYILYENPFEHLAFFAGVGSGKTFTGAEWVIQQLKDDPMRVGLIGANSYDQLSTATLSQLFTRFQFHGLPYVVDRQPPKEWGQRRRLKSYNNTIQVLIQGQVALILTRVMSDPDIGLRGFEIAWYWLDETRDTSEYAHNLLLGRMRQQKYRKGLITTTTNGEDWCYNRFVKAKKGQSTYGSIHVSTREAVRYGILTAGYYNLLLSTYSPLLAQQELEALHVNVSGGRAYYAAGDANRCRRAPWGDLVPNLDRPLIVGCDFNFSPAPCVWVCGQIGPFGYENKIHWFKEISAMEVSTVQMTQMLMAQFPGFFYKLFGDASGNRGTTSNAGETDYNQIGQTLSEANCLFSIDVEPSNPLVKDRVENMNALFKNALNEVRMTYNDQECPLVDQDVKKVGWKKRAGINSSLGKLDDGGDSQLTHASDGVGYAAFKLFPPGRTFEIVESIKSHRGGLNEYQGDLG